MNTFKTLILGLGLSASLTLVACSSSPLDEMKAAKDKICACKDMACVTELSKDKSGLKDKMEKMSDEDKKKAMAIGLELAECITKLSE